MSEDQEKNVVDLDDYRPHVIIEDHQNKTVWVTPLSLLEDVALGKKPVTHIEDWEKYIPALIGQY